MKLFTKIIIICIFTNLNLKTAKAQLTYIGSSYSLTNTNTDWNAKFTKGVINMGNPNSWQSFFQSPSSYSSALSNDKYYVLMSFNRNPDTAAILRLNSVGVKLLKYVPSQTYWVEISSATTSLNILNTVNTADFFVLKIALFPESWKLDGDLEIYKTDSDSVLAMHYLNLSIHKGPTFSYIDSGLRALGISIIDTSNVFNTVGIETNGLHFSAISALPYVYFIQNADIRMAEAANTSYINNFISSTYSNVGSKGLSGNGVMINLYEAFLTQHIDFRLRNNNVLNTIGIRNHGTSMAGLAAGAGTLNPHSKGIAPKSSLTTLHFSIPFFVPGNLTNWNNYLSWNLNTQISIHSSVMITGIGPTCTTGAIYHLASLSIDLESIVRPNLLQFYSAGNNPFPGFGCSPSTYHSTVSLYCAGKNNIVIGEVDANNVVQGTSAWGPVADGRIKPDLVSLGFPDIYPLNIDQYEIGLGGGGTSFSNAIAAGAGALVYERYKQMFSMWPKATLVKGLFMNSADDIENPGPDYKAGYGSINMYKTIQNLNAGNYISGTISNGQTLSYSFLPGSVGITSKVMLIWQDLEATSGAATALVRDLDLLVWNGASVAGRPSILDPSIPFNYSLTGADHLNNVEQVTLTNTLSGYTVTVNGFNIPNGATQEFFLLFTNADWGLKLVYPNGGNILNPGTTETIRWNANSLPGGSTLSLEYTIDNGTTWIPIAAGITGATTRFNWMVPSTVTSQARIRVSQTWPFGISDMSDTVFAILGPPQGLAASTCENRVTLNWTTVTNASSYNIFKLDETTDAWALLGISTTNSFTTTENILACYYYTVEAVNTTTNTTSEKAIAIRLCLTANATLVGSMAITRSPNGCMSVGTTNIYLTSNTSIPAGSAVRWEISSDNGTSWVTTTLTQTGSSQWVIPYLQPYMGGWRYRLTYIDYTSCTKIVGNIIILDLDFDFTSGMTNTPLDQGLSNYWGLNTVTLSQTAGISYQWQMNFYQSTNQNCTYIPGVGWFSCPVYSGWEDIVCGLLSRLGVASCTQTDKYLAYPWLGVFSGYAHFRFAGFQSNSLEHEYMDPWGGPGPWSDDSKVAMAPHIIRCVASNNSCTRFSDEMTMPLYKTGNGTSGIDKNISNQNLQIYPNPVIDKEFIVRYDGIKNSQISILNAEGKEIFSAILSTDLTINVANWANGCYFVKFVDDDIVQMHKLIIQHNY